MQFYNVGIFFKYYTKITQLTKEYQLINYVEKNV